MRKQLLLIAEGFERQSQWCDDLGSPLTAYICRQAAKHIGGNKLLADLMLEFANNMRGSAAALRFTGAIHSLVLRGKAPDLKPWYEDGNQDYTQLWPQIDLLIQSHIAEFKQFVIEAPQTNEVARSAVLLAAFSEISKRIKLPISLYELGASAGLNLLFADFYYEMNGQKWGDKASGVNLSPNWLGKAIDLDFKLDIAQRFGCDLNPLDVNDPKDLLSLRAYIWPDMPGRKQRFEAAVKIGRKVGLKVDKADAAAWLKDKLQHLQARHGHVIYHTIAWQYFPDSVKTELTEMINLAGAQATKNCPLVHLAFEFDAQKGADLHFKIWDGTQAEGLEIKLGNAHPHGAEIEWLI